MNAGIATPDKPHRFYRQSRRAVPSQWCRHQGIGPSDGRAMDGFPLARQWRRRCGNGQVGNHDFSWSPYAKLGLSYV